MFIDDIKLFAKNEKELKTLIHAVKIYYKDVGMEFDREKCAILIMESDKRHLTDGMELPHQEKIRKLGEKDKISSRTGRLGNNRISWDHPNYCIIEIGKNWEEFWRLEENCRHSNFSERPSANTNVKNSQGVTMIIIIIILPNNWNNSETWGW